jgi:hypothetical protein
VARSEDSHTSIDTLLDIHWFGSDNHLYLRL